MKSIPDLAMSSAVRRPPPRARRRAATTTPTPRIAGPLPTRRSPRPRCATSAAAPATPRASSTRVRDQRLAPPRERTEPYLRVSDAVPDGLDHGGSSARRSSRLRARVASSPPRSRTRRRRRSRTPGGDALGAAEAAARACERRPPGGRRACSGRARARRDPRGERGRDTRLVAQQFAVAAQGGERGSCPSSSPRWTSRAPDKAVRRSESG